MYFLIMAILVAFSALLVRFLPFYKKIIAIEERGRFESLDGLRGFLALNVLFQHAMTAYFYFQNGVWEIVPIKFYRFLGGEAVILFFILTSFLYWSKAIKQNGDIDASAVYRSRFLRLAPMYLFSAAIVVFSVVVQSGFNFDWFQMAKDILSWLSLGLITTTSVNHITVMPINAGIHWTLHFEWAFYLVLPILAIAVKNKKTWIMALPLAFFALSSPDRGYWAIFFFGIMAAHIYAKFPKPNFLSTRHIQPYARAILSLVALVGTGVVYTMNYKPYSVPQYFISLVIFLAFVYGADLFGFLKTNVAKFLGSISYSVYLIHGIVLYGVLNSFDYFRSIMTISPLMYWTLILISGLITIVISSITYHYIEYPFIKRIKSPKGDVDPKNLPIVDQVM